MLLCLWQSPEGIGACRVDDPGSLTWNELGTDDAATEIDFYSGLFGWQIEPGDAGDAGDAGPYWTIGLGSRPDRFGGIREQSDAPARWLPYFAVASLYDALTHAKSMGGRLVAGPRDLQDRRSAVLSDPQTTEFGVLEVAQ